VSTPPANTIPQRKPEQPPVKPVLKPASPATPASPRAASLQASAPPAAVIPKPVKTDVVKPAPPLKPELSKPEPSKPEPGKPEAALIAPSPTAPVTPATETLTIALNDLPLSIHGQWTLDRDESRCTLQSVTQKMEDGQGGTKIHLWLTTNEMSFLTESDIDLSYTGTGITIDGGQHFDLETIERRTNPVFSKQRATLLDAMKSGKSLQLTLGFWPSWPVTHTYSVSFPLQHFATAYAAWETCNTQLNPR